MTLFQKRKIIYFLHIYKTGGTTVNDMLFKNYPAGEIINLYGPLGGTGKIEDVVRLYDNLNLKKDTRIVYGHYAYGIHRKFSRPYTYMCFVREPFSRLISMYYNLHRLEKWWQCKVIDDHRSGSVAIPEIPTIIPTLKDFFGFEGVQNQQCMFLTGVSPQEINKDQDYYGKMAIENIINDFSFIGLNEAFDISLAHLQRILKLNTTSYAYKNLGENKPGEIRDSDKLREMAVENSKADKMIYDFVLKRFYS